MLVIPHKRKLKRGSGFIDTITKVADVMGNVAKTAGAAKQIYDVIKTRKKDKTINKVLSDKSNDILARLSKT